MSSQNKKTAQKQGARKCDICGCLVAGGDNGWQTHAAGIRHRRNAASCRVFGEPGHHVVSAFERIDGPPPARYRGKDDVLLAAAAAAQSTPATAAPNPSRQQLTPAAAAAASNSARSHAQIIQQLQLQCRKHLANQIGVCTIYHRAVERFTVDALSAAWQFVEAQFTPQFQEAAQAAAPEAAEPSQSPQQQQTDRSAAQPAQQPHNQQQQQAPNSQGNNNSSQGNNSSSIGPRDTGSSKPQFQVKLALQEPAQIACLAEVLPDSVHSLEVSVPYHTYGPVAAASTAAVACFMSSLSRHQQLQELHLVFNSTDYSRIVRQGGGALTRVPELWGKVARTAAEAMKVNCGLLELHLTAYPGQFPPDELAKLQKTLIQSRQQLRAAVLLGTHSRVGRNSLLHLLPHEVMVILVELAVPKACRVVLKMPRNAFFVASSSSESESESESENESDSSSGSSSESETASSSGGD